MRDRLLPVRDVLADCEMEMGPYAIAKSLTHWRLKRGDDGIAWLILDRADESVNTLSEEVIIELDEMLSDIERLVPK